jgi:hypothetical protein
MWLSNRRLRRTSPGGEPATSSTLQTVAHSPPVSAYSLGMAESEVEVVDIDRGGRWCQVMLMESATAVDARSRVDQLSAGRVAPYVGIVSADLGPELPEILAALGPGLQEIICFDSLLEPVVAGQDVAMRALEELGFGQDFVFTVEALEDAVDYAVERMLLRPDHGGWEGRFVVVLGPGPVVDQARRHLTQPA